jgi:hypothetical protein
MRMKRPLAAILLIAWGGLALGQQREREGDSYLQELRRKARAETTAESKSGLRATAGRLKVCVIAPEQDKLTADVGAWLDRWNQSEGGRYGQVERVMDASQADVILARFVSDEVKQHRSGDEGPSVKNDLLIDPVTHRPVPTAQAPKPPRYYVRAYSFVVARDSGVLNLLWRGTDEVSVSEDGERSGSKDSKKAGRRLRGKFSEMMKAWARAGG